jgi:hypothetical protein
MMPIGLRPFWQTKLCGLDVVAAGKAFSLNPRLPQKVTLDENQVSVTTRPCKKKQGRRSLV